MTIDHDENPADEMLLRAARDYNAPADVPREEMWSRIQAARLARRPIAKPRRLWVWPSVGVAAAMLMTVGVVIGRRWERQNAGAATAVASVSATAGTGDSSVASTTRTTDTSSASTAQVVGELRRETTATDRRARELASTNPPSGSPRGSEGDVSTSLSYRLVVLRHLAGSEAMITAFRSAAKRGEIDRQIGEWSKELLNTTRMLEASAATDDPTLKRLLEDLDLVLTQIKQYLARGTNSPDDLDLIEQSITKRGVITKLRSTIPARNAPVGT